MTALLQDLQIVVYGTPGPQGSKRHVGGGRMLESSAKVKPWREAVKWAALGHFTRTIEEPLTVDMVFTFTRPRSHYRTGRYAHLLRDEAPKRPVSRGLGDVSKLARSTEDALTDCGVWRDDALVVEYGRLAKVWAGEDVDALDRPGALIRVYTHQWGTS